MPMFQAKMLCKNLIILNVDYRYYELMSKEFISYISKYSRKIEQMSIDECFCDFTDYFKSLNNANILEVLKKLQIGLLNKTKLMCSIGVAPTKFLAKMGSDYKKPMGITIIRKRDISRIIFPLPIKDLFGIGKKTAPKLVKLGIQTIGEFYLALKNRDKRLDEVIGSFGNDLINDLEGNSSDEVISNRNDPKSIGMTRTLDFNTNDETYIKNFLEILIKNVLDEFKSKNMLTKTITLTYKDADYSTNFKSTTVSKTFNEYTDNQEYIYNEALKLFNNSFKNQTIRLIGFTVKNLKEKHNMTIQMTFDNYKKHEEENKTQLLIDELNRKYKDKKFIRLSDLDK